MNNSEQYRLECEVKTWKRLIKENGRSWWEAKKEKIREKRGQVGLDYLLAEMNKK